MRVEARSPSCWSSVYVLKCDGRPIGEFHARLFSETVEVELLGGRRLRCVQTSFWGGRLELTEHGSAIARAHVEGLLERCWRLDLSCGPATLTSAGIFNTAFVLNVAGVEVGHVEQIGLCEGGWYVDCGEPLTEADAIFVGLVYRTIRRRHAAAVTAATG